MPVAVPGSDRPLLPYARSHTVTRSVAELGLHGARLDWSLFVGASIPIGRLLRDLTGEDK